MSTNEHFKQVICVLVVCSEINFVIYFHHLSRKNLKCLNRESAVRTKCPALVAEPLKLASHVHPA